MCGRAARSLTGSSYFDTEHEGHYDSLVLPNEHMYVQTDTFELKYLLHIAVKRAY